MSEIIMLFIPYDRIGKNIHETLSQRLGTSAIVTSIQPAQYHWLGVTYAIIVCFTRDSSNICIPQFHAKRS